MLLGYQIHCPYLGKYYLGPPWCCLSLRLLGHHPNVFNLICPKCSALPSPNRPLNAFELADLLKATAPAFPSAGQGKVMKGRIGDEGVSWQWVPWARSFGPGEEPWLRRSL